MVRRQSTLPNEFGYVPIAERKIQIPTYAAKDHFSFVMSPMEWVIRGDRHGALILSERRESNFATEPVQLANIDRLVSQVLDAAETDHRDMVNRFPICQKGGLQSIHQVLASRSDASA